MVTACYNTCFALEESNRVFLVDAGGGNQIFSQLDRAHLDWHHIQDIFVTHKHIDHIMGIVWMIRLYCQNYASGKFTEDVRIYAHDEVISILQQMASLLLVPKQSRFIGEKLHLITVEDGESREIIGHEVRFFDIHSSKAKQFGFTMQLNDEKKLTCCGDEPCCKENEVFVQDCDWLLHEAFCLYGHRDVFKPYEKHHSTVKDACEIAQRLGVKNMILYHTEDKNIATRKELYLQEGAAYYTGNLYVPDDLDTFELTDQPEGIS